jgi:D-arginine dehydrogenase
VQFEKAGSLSQVASDILIVGGGIAGLSLAAAIGRRRSVVLVEAEPTFAFHTSSRSAQQMQPTYGPPEIRAITRASIALVQEIAKTTGTSILSPRPLLWGGFGDTATPLAELIAENPGVSELTMARALELLPVIRAESLRFAGIDNNAHEVDVPALLRWYQTEAERAGATLLAGSPATRAARSGDLWTVTAGSHEFSAPVVVNAAGAWADAIAGLFEQEPRGLHPYRRTVVIGDAKGATVDPRWPMLGDSDDTFYFRPYGTQILASPMEDAESAAEDARPRQPDVETALARVNAVTTLDLVESRSWTGLRTLPADGLPVVGWSDAEHSFYWLAGQGGYGIQTSAGIARFVAAQLTDESAELPDEAIEAFAGLRASRL